MATEKKPRDLVLVQGRTPDGLGTRVLRARDERIEIGTMRPLEHGKPIVGEVVKLTPRPEAPLLFDAETQFTTNTPEPSAEGSESEHPRASSAGQGPPKVATNAYRKNWDAIWSRSPRRARLPN